MKNTCLLSEDAKNYLCCYYQTLDEMIQAMTTAGLNQSISHNAAAQMLPHCRAAIRMSGNVLRYMENPAVRQTAQRLTEEQTQIIDRLESVLPACGQITNARMDLQLHQRRADLICREMFARMGAAPEGNRLDLAFARQLLPHCQGAVRLAENALKYDVSTELVPILRRIAAQQRRRSAHLRAFLGRAGCPAS